MLSPASLKALKVIGFSPAMQHAWEQLAPFHPDTEPARVFAMHRGEYHVLTATEEFRATLPFLNPGERLDEDFIMPVAGDWIVLKRDSGHELPFVMATLPRHTRLSRKTPGRTFEEQVIAANVDTVLIAMSMNDNFSVNRLERYILMVRASGAKPVVVMTKSDLVDDPAPYFAQANSSASGADVIAVSSMKKKTLKALAPFLHKGETLALVGSSGVGKSTLVNALMGEEVMDTFEVREKDDRGRHITTHRELFILPGGALLLDNPGMREVQPWIADYDLDEAYGDVIAVMTQCRFGNCGHGNEPGCAVRAAIAAGTFSAARLQNYLELRAEQDELRARIAEREDRREKKPVREKDRYDPERMRFRGKKR